MQAFTIANEEGITAVEAFLAENAYLSGGNSPGAQDADLLTEMEAAKFVCSPTTTPNLFGWWWTLSPFRQNARDLWRKGGAKKAGKKAAPAKEAEAAPAPAEGDAPAPAEEDDDDVDGLFDSDSEAEEAAKKQREAKKAEKTKKKKAKKIAKSVVVFDVKGYEVDCDWNAMAEKIRTEVNMEGLTWMDSHEIVPIAFGMKKLQMSCIIIDDLVGTDDIFDKIMVWDDDVQSCDIVSFDKA